MTNENGSIVLTTEQARGGETPGVVRYVLGVSLGLSILAMVLVGTLMT